MVALTTAKNTVKRHVKGNVVVFSAEREEIASSSLREKNFKCQKTTTLRYIKTTISKQLGNWSLAWQYDDD